ncbi:MAG TPA: hypothetical protein VJV79_12775 [Polyangiaceae bacterium]|nr:hypothetical protein [Polyangiaceae bacterium]
MPLWRVAPGWLEGRELLAVLRGDDTRPAYFIQLDVEGGQVIAIRDYHHVPYVASEAPITLATR